MSSSNLSGNKRAPDFASLMGGSPLAAGTAKRQDRGDANDTCSINQNFDVFLALNRHGQSQTNPEQVEDRKRPATTRPAAPHLALLQNRENMGESSGVVLSHGQQQQRSDNTTNGISQQLLQRAAQELLASQRASFLNSRPDRAGTTPSFNAAATVMHGGGNNSHASAGSTTELIQLLAQAVPRCPSSIPLAQQARSPSLGALALQAASPVSATAQAPPMDSATRLIADLYQSRLSSAAASMQRNQLLLQEVTARREAANRLLLEAQMASRLRQYSLGLEAQVGVATHPRHAVASPTTASMATSTSVAGSGSELAATDHTLLGTLARISSSTASPSTPPSSRGGASPSQAAAFVCSKRNVEIPQSLPQKLALPEDKLKLSSHQALLRHQVEVFKASEDDVSTHTRGRNKPVRLGQIGVRCRWCAHLPVVRRNKGSTYFPATLMGIYQACQNMAATHMQSGLCACMPREIQQQLVVLLSAKLANSGAGRPYWANSAKALGLIDTGDGIRFLRDFPKSDWQELHMESEKLEVERKNSRQKK